MAQHHWSFVSDSIDIFRGKFCFLLILVTDLKDSRFSFFQFFASFFYLYEISSFTLKRFPSPIFAFDAEAFLGYESHNLM